MIMRNIVKHTAGILPFKLLLNFVKPKLVAPFYHIVSSNTPPHLQGLYSVIRPEQFIKDLDFLLKYFAPITSDELPLILSGEKSFSKPALFLSFDDGLSEIETVVAPILQQKGVPATFFVTPNFVGNNDMLYRFKINLVSQSIRASDVFNDFQKYILRERGKEIKSLRCADVYLFMLNYNDSTHIEQIAKVVGLNFADYLSSNKPYLTYESLLNLTNLGFNIGAHSLNHPLFSDLALKDQIEEIEGSVKWINRYFPNQPKLFAFPFTDFGVEPNLFRHFLVDNPHLVDIFFGTAGYKPTNSVKFIHRISMDDRVFNAKRIIKGELFYFLAKSLVGKQKANLPI
jgi:peptidoglycan/xylan/chitin deacetylase (PgdA/CDA1 family)